MPAEIDAAPGWRSRNSRGDDRPGARTRWSGSAPIGATAITPRRRSAGDSATTSASAGRLVGQRRRHEPDRRRGSPGRTRRSRARHAARPRSSSRDDFGAVDRVHDAGVAGDRAALVRLQPPDEVPPHGLGHPDRHGTIELRDLGRGLLVAALADVADAELARIATSDAGKLFVTATRVIAVRVAAHARAGVDQATREPRRAPRPAPPAGAGRAARSRGSRPVRT